MIDAAARGLVANTSDQYALLQSLLDEAGAMSPPNGVQLPPGTIGLSHPLLSKGAHLWGDPLTMTAFAPSFGAGYTLKVKQPSGSIPVTSALVPGPGQAMTMGAHLPWLGLQTDPYTDFRALSQLTIEFFFKKGAVLSPGGVFFGCSGQIGTASPTISVGIIEQLDNRIAMYWDGGQWASNTPDAVMSPGIVNHIALAYDGATVRTFLNGKLAVAHNATGLVPMKAWDNVLIGNQSIRGLDESSVLSGGPDGIIDSVRVSSNCRYVSPFTPPTSKHVFDATTLLLINFDHIDGESVVGQNPIGSTWFDAYGIGGALFTSPTFKNLTFLGQQSASGIRVYNAILGVYENIGAVNCRNGVALSGTTYGSQLKRFGLNCTGYSLAFCNQSMAVVAERLFLNDSIFPLYIDGPTGGSFTDILLTPSTKTYASALLKGGQNVNFYAVQVDDEGLAPNVKAGIICDTGHASIFGGQLVSHNGAEMVRCSRGGSVRLYGTGMFAANGTPEMINMIDQPQFPCVASGVINNNPSVPLTNHPEWFGV